jgi:prepilin-type N-terminal cleavage/methylation domain-containing protein
MFRKKSGFTMIEVMVSLAIFVGCLASVLGGYSLLSRPYRGMYDGARELIADIENCAIHFDEIIVGNNGISSKGGKKIKSLLVDGDFKVLLVSKNKSSARSWWNPMNIFKAFGSIWGGKKDSLAFWDKISDLRIKGKRKSIRLCQFSIDDHPILDAAKKRYGANNIVMKNVYFYSFKDTDESLLAKLGFGS